jgi:hypothetical protein
MVAHHLLYVSNYNIFNNKLQAFLSFNLVFIAESEVE